jgi:hypothetical protein
MTSCLLALDQPKAAGTVWVRWRGRWGVAVVVATAAVGFAGDLYQAAFGQVAQTLNGPPVQVRPYVPEPGMPLITINPGAVNPFAGVDGLDAGSGTTAASGGDGTGTDGSATATASGQDFSGGAGGGSASSSGATAGNSTALGTMLGTSWGATAVANAQAVGVNPSALAATCVLESGCQNVEGSGTVAGAFQMTASTYTAMINVATAQNADLAIQIAPGLAGQMDPATESIAASEYLLQGAQYLQSNGISDPSVMQVRGYYNFGPSNGLALAIADPNETMAAAMPTVSAATLAANGISSGETVAQWQAGVAAKIGSAANQSVLGV